jgi:hypothetical protein
MPDFVITDHGTIVTFRADTPEALDWLEENVVSEGWQYLGSTLCVDHRRAADLAAGIDGAGFDIEVR